MPKAMIEQQLKSRGIKDSRVLKVMQKVPRHAFVPPSYRDYAYADTPLPIGEKQTISQPYMVAFMTEILELKGSEKVLEIGTGSGYQAAILAELCREVYSVEIIESLARRANKLLRDLGYVHIRIKLGDGYLGWKEHAPYDAIIVTCSPTHIPSALEEQLKEGGKMIIPVGPSGGHQELFLLEKKNGQMRQKNIFAVRFVPMTKRGGESY